MEMLGAYWEIKGNEKKSCLFYADKNQSTKK
jgi:hypothetical protein